MAGSDPWEERKQDLNWNPGPGSQLCLPCFQIHRDPRFDDLSGEYKPEVFMKTYSFLDAIKKQEKEVMLYFMPVLDQENLAWQEQLPQRPFAAELAGRQ